MRVVSFHTPDPIYSDYARRLAESCRAHNLPYTIVSLDCQGLDWVEITLLKPSFLLHCMRIHACPLLWIDADGYVAAPPAALSHAPDFGIYAHERRKRSWTPIGRGVETLPETWPDTRWFLSGTVFVRNTKPAIDLLLAWKRLAREQPRGYEQLLCQYAWCEVRPNTLWLPETYCSIYGRAKPPVICHDLASRRRRGVRRA